MLPSNALLYSSSVMCAQRVRAVFTQTPSESAITPSKSKSTNFLCGITASYQGRGLSCFRGRGTHKELPYFLDNNDRERDGNNEEPFGERERHGVEYALKGRRIHDEKLESNDNQGRAYQKHVRERVHSKDRFIFGAAVPCVEPLEYR